MKTMIHRVYVDNSVIGGLHDVEFAQYTEVLLAEFQSGLYHPVISDITEQEIKGAPPQVIKSFNELKQISQYVFLNEEAIALSSAYIKDGKFTNRMRADTLHIAIASVNK